MKLSKVLLDLTGLQWTLSLIGGQRGVRLKDLKESFTVRKKQMNFWFSSQQSRRIKMSSP